MTDDVVLNFGTESPFASVFLQFCSVLSLANGKDLLHLECSEVTDAGPYLAVVCAEPSKFPGCQFRIPHGLVLLISDAGLPEKAPGFHGS